jgi:geranylgeranyl pyrophosphate synthase
MKYQALAARAGSPLLDLLDRELEAGGMTGVSSRLWEQALWGPAREFLRRPGKEFRARLVEAAWRLGGGEPALMPGALPLLVEILHAGSLIVDDIEDEAAERRGAPALHRLCGVPLALNTGNWMYFWPLVVIGRLPLRDHVALELYRRTSATLARCHQGQALDLAVKVHELPQHEVAAVVTATTTLKTGSLVEYAAVLGASAAGAPPSLVAALAGFGRELGVALQMLDDLGAVAVDARADKAREDLRAARPTWPWAWLAERIDQVSFAKLQLEAREVARGADSGPLIAELRAAVAAHGRDAARRRLGDALDGLRRKVGEGPVLAALEDELSRLEASYG